MNSMNWPNQVRDSINLYQLIKFNQNNIFILMLILINLIVLLIEFKFRNKRNFSLMIRIERLFFFKFKDNFFVRKLSVDSGNSFELFFNYLSVSFIQLSMKRKYQTSVLTFYKILIRRLCI